MSSIRYGTRLGVLKENCFSFVQQVFQLNTQHTLALNTHWQRDSVSECVCVYYCRTYYKAVRGGGEEESGGHVL